MSEALDFLNMSDEEAVSGMNKLREMRKAQTNRGFSNAYFNVSKIKTGASATFRFLPDKNKNMYPAFIIEKKTIGLKFVDLNADDTFVRINLPVREMYDASQKCPLLQKVKPLYEEAKAMEKAGKTVEMKRLRDLAGQHWIDPEFIGQGFVIKAGFDEENVPENPIRLVSLRKTLFKIVDAGINSEDEELRLAAWPAHPRLGTNFIIRKTVKNAPDGPQNSYETSGWSKNSTPLDEKQIAAVEKYGLTDLSTLLPQRPSEDEYKFLTFLMEQSLAGNRDWNPEWEAELTTVKPFRVDKDGKGIRNKQESKTSVQVRESMPDGDGGQSSDEAMSALSRGTRDDDETTTPEQPAQVAKVEAPVETTTATEKGSEATMDLAARIRARMAKK